MKKVRTYDPAYFLAALGNGGLATSFFMYLMFMVPHPGVPMVTFNHLYPYIMEGSPVISVLILLAIAGMLYFSFRHFQRLIWNIRQFRKFKRTESYEKMKNTNGAVTMMAIPLTLAMMINVMFVLGAVLVPNLWDYIEILLPFALVGFLAIGAYALWIFVPMMTSFMLEKTFNIDKNNNFSQLLAVFAFAMIAVGLAAPGAISRIKVVSAFGIFFSLLFLMISISLMFVHIVLSLQSIFKHGFAEQAGPSVWMIIPILTLVGITGIRLSDGFFHNFLNMDPIPAFFFIMFGAIIAIQIIVGLVGALVLKRLNYFKDYIDGPKFSPGSYGLICPGVAFFVLGTFFIHWGLVNTGVVEMFSPMYFIVYVPFIISQLKTLHVISKLNKRHFRIAKQVRASVQDEAIQ